MKINLVKLLHRLGALKHFNLIVEKKNLKLPLLGNIGFSNLANAEPWMEAVLNMLFTLNEGTFIDVGVNVGQTLLKVKSINKDQEYIGFEPNPNCIFYAEQLIKVNNFKHCIVIPAGISNTTGILKLHSYSDDLSDTSASIIPDFRTQPVKQEKHIVVSDLSIVNTVIKNKAGIIKIDVEGAELFVLQGLRTLIEKDRPAIIIEVLPVYSTSNQERLDRQLQLEQLLLELDFIILKIVKTSTNAFLQLQPIKEIGVHSNLNECDYLFVPKEMGSIILNRSQLM